VGVVIGGRNNDVCVVSEFDELVARIHCSEVSYNGGALDDARCNFSQCRSLIAVDRAVGMFNKE